MRRFLASFAAFALLLACQKEEDHPANLGNCDSATDCTKPPVKGGGGGDSGLTDGAVTDAPGSSISGSILVLTDDDFSTGIPLPGTGTVSVEGESGLAVVGNYNGEAYSVSGVKIDATVWATVEPQPADGLPTAQPLNTTSTNQFDLVAVQDGTLELIYGILTAPTTRELGTAQIVLRFIDQTGAPISGITVAHQNEIIAYDSSGSWLDDGLGTGEQGFAIVANVVPAATATKQTFSFTVGSVTSGVELWVEADTVTIADVLVLPP